MDGFTDADEFQEGQCCFCGIDAPGLPTQEAINHTYFNDYAVMRQDTEHVCKFCAACMATRDLKNGHWVVTEDEFVNPSTGDLYDVLDTATSGEYGVPIAVHVSENPIRSEHGYLKTPVSERSDPLQLSYGSSPVRLQWDSFAQLVDDIETLRGAGFRIDDIRSDTPRINDLEQLGADQYRELDTRIDPARGSLLFELALMVSTCP